MLSFLTTELVFLYPSALCCGWGASINGGVYRGVYSDVRWAYSIELVGHFFLLLLISGPNTFDKILPPQKCLYSLTNSTTNPHPKKTKNEKKKRKGEKVRGRLELNRHHPQKERCFFTNGQLFFLMCGVVFLYFFVGLLT